MAKICTDINQQEDMLYWIRELTRFTPRQAEQVLQQLRAKQQPNPSVD